MATITRTIGASGADYTTLAAWQTGRAASSTAGDTEEAVLLDTPNTETVTFTASSWANNVTLRIRANTPHNGDLTAGVIKTSGIWTASWNSTTVAFNFEVQDIHFDLTSIGGFARIFSAGPSIAAAAFGTLRFINPIVSNGSTANTRGVYMVGDSSGQTGSLAVEITNPLIHDCTVGSFVFGGSQAMTFNIDLQGGTIYNGRLAWVRNAAFTINLDCVGTLFSTVSGSGEYADLGGTSGTVTATSERCITSRSEANHTTLFGTRTGNTYDAVFVTGTPGSGEVGFTDISGNDFSLVDHANNIAIDYVTSGTMPATDIAGETRDATPDCGAFEVVSVGSAPDAPTGFTSGAITHNSLTFTWTDVATDEDGYEVEYQVDGDVGWTVWDAALPADTETDTITGLTAATIYNIRVRATNTFGDSAWLTGQMTTDAAPASTGTRRSGMGLGLGLGLGRSRRGGGGSSASSTLYWSAASSWPGGVPEAAEDVTIPAGTTIVLDEDTAALGSLTIEGTLVVQPGATVTMTTGRVMVDGGVFQCGTEATPFTGNFTLTLTGTTPSHTTDGEDGSKLNNGLTRGLMVTNGGVLDFHGNVPDVVYTRIGAHIDVSVDDNTIVLSEAVDWPVGAKIILSKTDFYSVGNTEELTIAARPDSTTITVSENIATDRWGVMQYATDSGMSLSPGTLTKSDPLTPETLDERATVALLTRNIVIQGANDTTWSTDGIGGHTMVDDNTCTYRLEGVEFRRMGQKHSKGRYPIHFHMLSWVSNLDPTPELRGTWLGEAPAERFYVKGCSVAGSMNRGCVIHGTHGVLVEDNVFFDVKGHAVFEEDGAEEDNIIQRNCVMKVRDPGSGARIKVHDAEASGFWLVNPNNKVRQNIASDCQGRGFWNSFAEDPFGLSRDVTVVPYHIVIDEFDDNIGHSNALQGFRTNGAVTNEAGNTSDLRYLGNAPVTIFTMNRNQSWKNATNGYDNRVMRGMYNHWTMADNDGSPSFATSGDFVGSSADIAKNTGPLLIYQSLNNATAFTYPLKQAVASYHFEMDFPNLVAIGYQLATAEITSNGAQVQGGGVMANGDLYTNGAFYQFGRSPGWRLINSDAGMLPTSPYFDGFTLGPFSGSYRYWTLGVLHDPYGYWSTAGHWLMPDRDLYTYGLTTTPVPGQSDHVSAEVHLYGVERVQADHPDAGDTIGWTGSARFRIVWNRLDTSNTVIDSHDVGEYVTGSFFGGMRSFIANRAGRFRVDFPDIDLTHLDAINIVTRLCHKTEDWFLLGVSWDGARVPSRVSLDTSGPTAGTITRSIALTGTSIADVIADTNGATGWQDTANDLLWVQVRGTESGSYAYTDPELVESNSVANYARYLHIVA